VFPVLGASHPELCKTSRQMFGAATNTNKFCIATGGPVLASGEHMSGGLVAARSLVAARGLSAAHDWVGGSPGQLYQFFKLFFIYKLAPGLVAAPRTRKVH